MHTWLFYYKCPDFVKAVPPFKHSANWIFSQLWRLHYIDIDIVIDNFFLLFTCLGFIAFLGLYKSIYYTTNSFVAVTEHIYRFEKHKRVYEVRADADVLKHLYRKAATCYFLSKGFYIVWLRYTIAKTVLLLVTKWSLCFSYFQ